MWDVLIKYIIPIILGILLAFTIVDNIMNNPYPDYPGWSVVLVGATPLIIISILSFVLMRIKGKREVLET